MPLSVPAPASLAAPISVPLKTMTGPGPSNVADRVLQAQALPTLGHLHPEFTKVRDYSRAGDEPSRSLKFYNHGEGTYLDLLLSLFESAI